MSRRVLVMFGKRNWGTVWRLGNYWPNRIIIIAFGLAYGFVLLDKIIGQPMPIAGPTKDWWSYNSFMMIYLACIEVMAIYALLFLFLRDQLGNNRTSNIVGGFCPDKKSSENTICKHLGHRFGKERYDKRRIISPGFEGFYVAKRKCKRCGAIEEDLWIKKRGAKIDIRELELSE